METQPISSVGELIDHLSTRMAFWAGVVTTVVVIFSLGFLWFASSAWKKVTNQATAVVAPNVNVNTAPTPTPTAPTQLADSAIGKTVDLSAIDNNRVTGTGDYTFIEYSDTECPFCKRFHPTMQQVVSQYQGKVRWAYKYLPLTSLHSKAPREANATACAAEQGKFWDYINKLFEVTPSNNGLDDQQLFTIADTVKLDRKKFDACVNGNTYASVVTKESSEADSFGGQGTPFGLLVDKNGKILDVISGALPFAQLKTKLDQYIK